MSTLVEQIEDALGELELAIERANFKAATDYTNAVSTAIDTGGNPSLIAAPILKSLSQIVRESHI